MTPPRREALARGPWPVVLLLLLHLGLLLDGARRDTMTFDEPMFIAGGLATWEGETRIFPEGGVLTQAVEALPLVLAGVELDPDPGAWNRSDAAALGAGLLYGSGHDPRRLVFLARLPIALLSVLLCGMTWALARRLLGPGPALLTLVVHALSPAFLAHGRLATADLMAAVTFLPAAWLAGACLDRVTWPRVLASCLVTGAAFLAKASALLLVPTILVVVLVRWAAGAPTFLGGGSRRAVTVPGRIAVAGALVLLHAAAVVLAIWLAHGLTWAAIRPGDDAVVLKDGGWAAIEREGALSAAVGVARERHLLPEAWLFGLQYVTKWADARRGYLEGRYGLHGWWWFFPRALVLKTPLSALVLVVLGAAAFAQAWRGGARLTAEREGASPAASWARSSVGRDLLALVPLLAFFVVYWGVAMTSSLNIGFRHVLPTLPVLFLIAGAAWRLAGARLRQLVLALGALAAIEGASAHPDAIAWMNLGAGPEASRWTHLVDSSLDWGQGLAETKDVLEEMRAGGDRSTVHLAYFGLADPAAEGLGARRLQSHSYAWAPMDGSLPEAGIFVVSATTLVQLIPRSCPGPWRASYEAAWRAAEAKVTTYREASEQERARMREGEGAVEWTKALVEHEELLCGRLCAFLRQRPPERSIAGGAMLLWRLDEADVRAALFGPPPELDPGPPPFAVFRAGAAEP